jgi:selenoprotein W-related protein
MSDTPTPNSSRRSPRIEIEYCTMCRWLLRAGWTAQELLTTFPTEIAEVALIPGAGGTFDIRLDGELIYSRKAAGGFPELKHLKQLIRDRIDPERGLGHSDHHDDQQQ